MDADILIAGAGCSGLSLAVHLQRAGGEQLKITILEPRLEYPRGRRWCFWNANRHPFEAAVSHRWHRWRVIHAGRAYLHESSTYAYEHVPSEAFYDQAIGLLDRSPNVTLRRGVRVHALEERAGRVIAATSDGELQARLAFDGRPPDERLEGLPDDAPRLLQHFLGVVVESTGPGFDPSTVTIMDFDVDQEAGIHFVYVLPLDHRRALIEDTYFGSKPFPDDVYLATIDAYARKHLGGSDWRELARERGAIPMGTGASAEAAPSRIGRIGIRAGLARASTGYAFLAIQRFSHVLAHRLARGAELEPVHMPRPYSRAAAVLDRVFLSYISRFPDRAPGLFARMFERTRPEPLVRFLSDTARVADHARVMAALPALPLTAEALRCLRRPG